MYLEKLKKTLNKLWGKDRAVNKLLETFPDDEKKIALRLISGYGNYKNLYKDLCSINATTLEEALEGVYVLNMERYNNIRKSPDSLDVLINRSLSEIKYDKVVRLALENFGNFKNILESINNDHIYMDNPYDIRFKYENNYEAFIADYMSLIDETTNYLSLDLLNINYKKVLKIIEETEDKEDFLNRIYDEIFNVSVRNKAIRLGTFAESLNELSYHFQPISA